MAAKKESPAVRAIKREAKVLAKTSEMTYCQILDDRARVGGYANWKALLRDNPHVVEISTDGVLLRIRFAKPIDQEPWSLDAVDGDIDDPDYLINAGLFFSEPQSIIWKDELTVEFGARDEYHALSILGTLPLRHLNKCGAVAEISVDRACRTIPLATVPAKRKLKHKAGEAEFAAFYEPSIQIYDEDLVDTSSWKFLCELAGGCSSDALYLSEAIENASRILKHPAEMLAMNVEQDSGVVTFEHHSSTPDLENPSWTLIDEYDTEDLGNYGYSGEMRLKVHVFTDRTIYHVEGHCLDLVMEKIGHLELSSPLSVKTTLWWSDQNWGETVPAVPCGALTMKIPHHTEEDGDILNMLPHFRSLGEMTVAPDEEPPYPVPPTRNRCLALIGDFPE